MALHPRLQQPTLESPVRRGHGFTLALALTVLAAGFAYAMPRTVLTNAEEDPQQAELVLSPTGSTHTPTATTPIPRPKKTKDKDETGQDGEDGGTERAENHGAAVSTAAHCDLDGKAHGEFVRSIAHDKDATVAEVEAACEAAKASAATAGATHGSTKKQAPSHGKSGKPKVTVDADDADADSDTDADDAPKGGPPEHAGPPEEAKGPKNKP